MIRMDPCGAALSALCFEGPFGCATHSVEWSAFGFCRVCRANRGEPCLALSGRVAGGRPDGNAVKLQHPHAYRSPLAAARRKWAAARSD